MSHEGFKELKCRDAGVDCEFLLRAQTDDEVSSLAGEHACRVHNGCERKSDLKKRMQSLIKSVWCLEGMCAREPQETQSVYWS